MSGVQRFLSGHKNHVRNATFSGPVKSIANAVVKKPVARSGNASASLSGTFTGTEPATFEVEITDNTPTTPLVTAPAFVGVGTGTMTGLDTGASTSRTITVELAELGELLRQAETELQGVTVKVREAGVDGNDLRFRVTRNLVFTPQAISLLTELPAGTQSAIGPEFDWDTKIMTGDGQVPTDAHRVSFGEDKNNIYVQYKKFVEGRYAYFFEPALKEDVKVGTIVNFVTDDYTVELRDAGGVLETYDNVVTLYDLLNAIKTTSELLVVEGPVTYDRAPGGQALAELAVRTDAHAESNTGFTGVVIQPTTPTELIEATCYAASAADDESAGIGNELWTVKGSVSGVIRESVRTGELIEAPHFSAKIAPKLPPAFSIAAQGRIALGAISYASREDARIKPGICPSALTLGINAQEQVLTFTYAARPAPGDCPCDQMAVPDLFGAECLGGLTEPDEGEGGATVAYQEDTITRLTDFYEWVADAIRDKSTYQQTDSADILVSDTGDVVVKNGVAPAAFTPHIPLQSPMVSGYQAISSRKTALETALEGILTDISGVSELGTEYRATRKEEGTEEDRNRGVYANAIMAKGKSLIELAEDFEKVLGWIDALGAGAAYTAGGAAWDAAVAELQGDIDGITGASFATIPIVMGLLSDRYLARLRQVLITAGISPLGKLDADGLAVGDDCWRDYGDAYYWQVSGASGAYAPAFNNRIYYSARKGRDGVYRGTKEFGLQINVACVNDLQVGDSFTVVISNIPDWERYVKGDKVTLGILKAGDLFFFGGQDGDNVQTWHVSDSADGALPPYALDLDTPVAYDSGTGIEFLINEGSVPFAKGDKFTFSIEGGHFRWRSIVAGVAGVWSAPAAIPSTPTVLGSGLSLSFTLGESPAFYTGDVYRFLALQPYALSNLKVPDFDQWAWGTANPAVLVVDLGASKTDIDALALIFHNLPSTATVLVEGSADGITYTWDETITWRKDVMGKLLAAPETARYVRLTITGAAGAALGGLYIGPALAFERSAEVSINRQYGMLRGAGINPKARHQGTGMGGRVTWREGSLTEDDYPDIVAMLDWLKEQEDEPLVIFPQATRQDEIIVATVESDSIDFDDVFHFQPSASHDRRLSVTLPLKAVLF